VNQVTRFDTSLPRLVQALIDVLGPDAVMAGQFLRNANGQLAFISAVPLDEVVHAAAQTATACIGRYARSGSAVLQPDHPGLASLRRQVHGYRESVDLAEGWSFPVQILEQRIVGQDWLHTPAGGLLPDAPSRHVFFSIKGGVGRSTALAVCATELARQGRKVLVIDLDLEAPGLGHMLLPDELLPAFGLLDAHVESHAGALDDDFLDSMVAASPFGRGHGLIDVVPAVGAQATRHPANVLAKIARAYLESHDEQDDRSVSFLERTRQITDRLAGLKRYDAILIDARAGLNESTAAALLGLQARVLLFGEQTPQTFAGYRYLLAHLDRFERVPGDDWLDRFQMVHAKASVDAGEQQKFRDQAHEIFKPLYRELPLDSSSADAITLPEYSVDDIEAPHHAWVVLRDSHYVEFNPLARPSELSPDFYARTYGALLKQVCPAEHATAT
jgi:MinD superfamily P-loop ATPase